MAKKRSSNKKTKEKFYITTTDEIPGMSITDIVGIVWGSEVHTRGLTSTLAASVRSWTGGEVNEMSNMVRHARMKTMHRLVKNAGDMGANGVVGLHFTSMALRPGVAEFVAYGTAVKVEKK